MAASSGMRRPGVGARRNERCIVI